MHTPLRLATGHWMFWCIGQFERRLYALMGAYCTIEGSLGMDLITVLTLPPYHFRYIFQVPTTLNLLMLS